MAISTEFLAPYAVHVEHSRGRLISEPDSPTRSPFQRDRDRIVHCTAFRRLSYKTQVFIYHEGDHYRTRLTHSLEVSQIARVLARVLRLDEDLTEALSLAHDLGHTPFGHVGERALDEATEDIGGFDHNAQSLRVVTELEQLYSDFDGLNLTWETLEGLVKHNGPLLQPDGKPVETIGENGIPLPIINYSKKHDLSLDQFASVEAQVAAIADDIAYNTHDIDDGLRAGLIDFAQLESVPLVRDLLQEMGREFEGLEHARRLYELKRRLITLFVDDVISETERRLERLKPGSLIDIRSSSQSVVAFSEDLEKKLDGLRAFLSSFVYQHPRIVRIMQSAEDIVLDLFQHYVDHPQNIPGDWAKNRDLNEADQRRSAIRDFVAGMTDRFAANEHARLFDVTPELS
ncbi:MAG: deoxyguanosinetriphosphate triphosphohydrolase [Methyloligellaceae bacterium]